MGLRWLLDALLEILLPSVGGHKYLSFGKNLLDILKPQSPPDLSSIPMCCCDVCPEHIVFFSRFQQKLGNVASNFCINYRGLQH